MHVLTSEQLMGLSPQAMRCSKQPVALGCKAATKGNRRHTSCTSASTRPSGHSMGICSLVHHRCSEGEGAAAVITRLGHRVQASGCSRRPTRTLAAARNLARSAAACAWRLHADHSSMACHCIESRTGIRMRWLAGDSDRLPRQDERVGHVLLCRSPDECMPI